MSLAIPLLLSIAYVQSDVSDEESSFDNIAFIKTGTENQLKLSNAANDTTIQFKLNGTTGKVGAGFISQDLNLTPKRVFIDIGDVSKHSDNPLRNDTQVTISFLLSGSNRESYYVKFVVGPLYSVGWLKNDFFEPVDPRSRTVLNLEGLTPSDGYSINKIALIAQSHSVIQEMEFALRFV